MAAHTPASLGIMKSQVWVNTSGLTKRSMRACGIKTKCMDRVFLCGRTAKGTRVNSRMIKERVEVFSSGKTVGSTRANG